MVAKKSNAKKKRGPGRPPKKKSDAKESDNSKPDYEQLLQDGRLAKVQLLQEFYNRIKKGEQLKPSELKKLNSLESEFDAEISKDSKSDIIDSFDDAAVYLGVSKRTVHVQLNKGTFKQNPDGTFNKSELDKYLGQKTSSLQMLAEKKEKADLRWRLARAQREEMLVKQLKGSLASWREIENQWCARVQEISAGLEMLADRLAPLLIGKSRVEMHEIIKLEIWKLRDSYARKGRYCPQVE